VRKQYHFRASPKGLRAWDVDRLVELAKDLPRQRIPLREIREIDEAYWSNEGTKALTCRDVVEHAQLMLACDLLFRSSSPRMAASWMECIAFAKRFCSDGVILRPFASRKIRHPTT
jgi:hypothetical protein